MAVTSLMFFAFFALSLLIFYLIPKRFRWIGLVLFSICFFISAARPWTIAYLIVEIISVWICANQTFAAKVQGNESKAKMVLVIGIIINIGILAVLKYNGFVIGNLNRLLPISISIPKWAAPLGISFYTIAALGYLMDCYWGNITPQRNLIKTALFVGYYPILTSGPIIRYNEIEKSLYGGCDFDYKKLTFGLQRVMWGVFQKMVISSRLGTAVNTIYGNIAAHQGLFIWFAAALFVLQLYTDFSGCMDIIIGVSECYGVKLPENFRTPLFSRSVQEFWQRWHITLGGWMRDYVLYPIMRSNAWRKMTKWIKTHWGKKAAKKIPSYLGMLCVWLLIGLWHGGAWKYIIGMGVWFWSCIVLSKEFEPTFKKLIKLFRINTECFSWHLFQSLRVFVLVSIGNMFFRLDSIGNVLRTIRAGFCFNIIQFVSGISGLFSSVNDIYISGIGLVVFLIVSVLKEKVSVRDWLSEQNLVFRWIILFMLLFSIVIMGVYGPGYDAQAFIYEKF